MKKSILILTFSLIGISGFTQPIYMTRNGQVSFFSKTPMENIDAINNEVNSMINATTGDIVFSLLVKGFRFERALMEEHFNENYMESDKFPKSTFQGKITNPENVDFTKAGTYAVTVAGDLTIHGIKKTIQIPGSLTVAKDKLTVVSTFPITLADYKIEIPALVAEKISKTLDISVNCDYKLKP
jgi:hypothetical protein